jgi:uncharacterized protein
MAQTFFRIKIKLIVFLISLLAFLFILPGFIFCDDVDFPSYTGFINDYVGKLDSSSKESLEDLASRVEKDTGSEIAVAIVDNLQGLTQEQYAVELFEEWGIGKKEEDNGILILIGIEGEAGKRPLKIEVGYGLEGVITDIEAGSIADDILIPELQKGDFYKGLYLTIMAIADQIYEEEGLEPISGVYDSGISAPSYENEISETPAGVFSFFTLPWICCIGLPFTMVVSGIIISLFKRRCPRCRKLKLKTKTTILKKATSTEKGKKLVERTCSNCGYYDRKELVIPKRSSSWTGGGSSGGSSSSGGGFGGFGGGSSGGGGASRGW